MSKATVATNTGSQNKLVALKKGRKELVSQDAISSWLEEAQSGKSLLSPVIPFSADGAQLEVEAQGMSTGTKSTYAAVLGAQGAILTAMGCWVANAVMASASLSHILPIWFDVSAIAAGAGLSGFGSYFFMSSNKKDKALWNTCLNVQSEGLRSWLWARYQVEVSDEALAVAAVDMLKHKETISLLDSNDRNWVLRLNIEKWNYQLEPRKIEVKPVHQETSLQQAPVTIAVGASFLPESAQKVVDSIDIRLSQLHKFALSTEQAHVVSRTVEDAREAVAAFERLDALGAGESGLERLTSILSLLDGELEKIVQVRIAEESVGFATHQKSVEARVSGVGA